MAVNKEEGTSRMKGLIADIGATNARFALADKGGIHGEKILPCADYPGLADAVRDYLGRVKPAAPRRASIAIAGPVTGDIFKMTNHPWAFSVKETTAALEFENIHLMNDFEALARAVPHLNPEDLKHVCGPAPVEGAPKGVIGPGTGLGVASLIWGGARYIPVPGEGGHVTMAAITRREFDLFEYLLKHKYHHVSAERVCSGKGLVNVYNGLRGLDGLEEKLPERTPEEISAAAMDGTCPLCRESLDMMISFLGRTARNLALTLGSFGGIYIAGGIVNRLGAYFYKSAFEREFIGEGRFTDYMRGVPVFSILHPFPAFVGLQASLMED